MKITTYFMQSDINGKNTQNSLKTIKIPSNNENLTENNKKNRQ